MAEGRRASRGGRVQDYGRSLDESSIIEVARNLYSLSLSLYIYLSSSSSNNLEFSTNWIFVDVRENIQRGRFAVCLIGSALSTRRFDISFGVEYGIFSGMVWGKEFLTPVSVHRIEGGQGEVEILDANLVSFRNVFSRCVS